MSYKSEGVEIEKSDESDIRTTPHDGTVEGEPQAYTIVKRDKHGLPFVPQPSPYSDDPLNWSPFLKLSVAIQVSWLACLGIMSAASINPAFVPLGKAFQINTVEASYELTVFIVFSGVGPLFTTPFANVYGRRPIYLIGNLLAAITNVIAGHCTTWSGILITRDFNGIAVGSIEAVGAATICDMYCMHERGVYMGIYTFFLTNGPHIAPLTGGYIAQYIDWRYCFTIPAYFQFATFVFTIFFLPETLYCHQALPSTKYQPKTYLNLLTFKNTRLADRRVRPSDILRPLQMLRYISIVIPSIYYMTNFGYGTALFAITGAQLFKKLYYFDVAQTGLMLSIPLLVGCLLGEFNAGWLTDWMVYRYARKHDGLRKPEARLDALWFAILIPIGIVIEGICLSHSENSSWVGVAMAMGIASFGLQVATTVVSAYTTDCYKPQSAEISTVLHLIRSGFSCLISFYAIPLGEKIEWQYAWLIFGIINVGTLFPMFALRRYGSEWRELKWQKPPSFHNDI
ncbi:hypothetical protein HYALB_00009322 [Hymenoscyphus albidus]|uniref:Major facilitator superfamily (MFS) profile domain-containing protein n=1 Tax=Hymenoscyphus albidus TaxID=595503 RepID=A0A9N9Q2Q9_9HELO|nr:hypothetical protein HYALB_00009322 [Hymenoscyphus albidus]